MKLNIHPLLNLVHTPIFWVVLSLALVTSPHLGRFPLWSVLLLFVLFIWRLIGTYNKAILPPKWLLVLISIVTIVGIYAHFGTIMGKTAGSVLLSVLLAIKLHESHTRRDFMLLSSLSFFIIVTNLLFSQSIPTVIFMLFTVLILLVSILTINQGKSPLSFKYKFQFSLKLLLQATPIVLLMFFLFPRISGPLWQLPEENKSTISGLSDSMTPGNISNLIKSNAVAFRVKFSDTIPPQNHLYWRGIVLWYFDGETWEQGKPNPSPFRPLYSQKDQIVNYTVTLEPHNKTWLFALDLPSKVPDTINYTNNYNLRARHKISTLFQYQISSVTQYHSNTPITPWEKSAGLNIPANTNPKTLQLAQQLSQRYSNKEDIVNYILHYFNKNNFHYTLNPPLTPGFNQIDQFLFDSQRGFCEHYAGSFTFLMRAAGIPARVVLGYQGGTINPVNHILTVRNSDAHAWAEVWYENKGWVRIDPTAAIAPQRIEQNLDAALDENESRPFHMQINGGLIKDALFYWDAIDNQWNQWVVGYDKQLQQDLLERVFNKKMPFNEIVIYMIGSLMLMIAILLLSILKPWQQQPVEPVIKYYQLFCKKLAKCAIVKTPEEGPKDFAERAMKSLPNQKSSIERISQLYIKIRYGSSHSDNELEQMKGLVKKFRVNKPFK